MTFLLSWTIHQAAAIDSRSIISAKPVKIPVDTRGHFQSYHKDYTQHILLISLSHQLVTGKF